MNSEIDRLLHRCRAWLFRTLANALFTPTGRSCTTCAGPDLVARQISARAVTAMARESHPLGQCTLLGELMDETHTRYCYRRRVDKRSPTIHLVPLRPVPTTPHHQRTGSSSRTWLRRPVRREAEDCAPL